MKRLTISRLAAAAGVTLAALLAGMAGPAAATAHDTIEGTGSSWAANAVNQWVADVQSFGLRVVYTAPGSAQGRKDFSFGNTDFAVSDIGYQGSDPKSGADDTSSRKYAYLPIVGGGTAFPYNLTVAGHRVTNLRLSGETLAKIFTNKITNWNDSQITKDNNGHAFPSKQIIPVVHSEGAGSTAQFTAYLADQFPSLWTPFNGASGLTEYFPRAGAQIAQNGSDGVMNYVTSSSGDGTIGYDEYSYPLGAGFPVAKIENKAGYFTLPTQFNDAVALTQAQINTDPSSPNYLLQNLHNVYTYGDPRTYPLSSYSYAIIPTGNTQSKPTAESRMTTPKRQTVADFLAYAVCDGQKEMGPIGYSSLPLNLVTASFGQISKLHAADSGVTVSLKPPKTCNNPTFDAAHPSRNKLAEVAPQPAACDQAGQGPCTDDTSTGAANSNPGGSTKSGGSTNNGGSRPAGGTAPAGGSGPSRGSQPTGTSSAKPGQPTGGATASAGRSVSVDPATGQLKTDTSAGGDGGGGDVIANPTELAAYKPNSNMAPYGVLAVVILVAVLVLPPVLARRFRRRRDAQ